MAPLPSTSTLRIQSNLGISHALHHLHEGVEKEYCVVGARRRFRMPLHRENWFALVFYAFNRLVVSVQEPALQRRFFKTIHVNGVTVILRGYVTPVGLQVQSRLVLRAMTKLHLVGVSAHRQH